MTMQDAWPLQQAVFTICDAASGVETTNFAPSNPPARYCRIDGFSAFDMSRWKNGEKFEHSFIVHVFDAQDQDQQSLAWVTQSLQEIHAAIIAQPLGDNWSRPKLELFNSTFDIEADSVHTAHAQARYTIQIGD